MDQRAEQAFQKLLEEIKQNVVNTYFKQMSEQMGQMSQQDISALREMARDLNSLVRQKLEGVPEAQLQHNYEDFLKKWGSMFPDAPATFDEFLAQLAAQMARMDSLMQSLSPEQRHQLEEMISATFGDPGPAGATRRADGRSRAALRSPPPRPAIFVLRQRATPVR